MSFTAWSLQVILVEDPENGRGRSAISEPQLKDVLSITLSTPADDRTE